MAIQLQLRRGNTAQHSTFTGAVGEVTVDTDKHVVVVHDGVNAGGTPLSTLAEAGVGFLGIHLNKQGIDPTGLLPSLSIKTYQDAIKQNQFIGPFIPENNRLIKCFYFKNSFKFICIYSSHNNLFIFFHIFWH